MRPLLPAVGPRRLAALALAAAATLASCAYFVRFLLKPYTGLVVNYPEAVWRDGAVLFAPRSPVSPAVRAGLLPYRDEILEVGRKPVASLRDLVEADLGVRTWEPVPVEVMRRGVGRRLLQVTPDFALGRIDTAFTTAFLVALSGLGFALLLDRSLEAGTWLLAAACFCYALFVAVKPFSYENVASNSLVHAGKLAPWLLLGFTAYYPRPRGAAAARRCAVAAVAVAYVCFAAGRLVLFADWCARGADAPLSAYRLLGKVANAAEAAAYVACAALLATAARSAEQPERARIQWMLAGLLVALPPYFFLDQLPIILDRQGAPRVGTGGFASLFLLPLPVLFTVGLATGRTLETRRLLARFAVYTVVAVTAVALLAGLYDPVAAEISTHYAMSTRDASLAAVFLLMAFVLPLQALLLRAVSRLVDAPASRKREPTDRASGSCPRGEPSWEERTQRDLARIARQVEGRTDQAVRRLGAALEALEGELGAASAGRAAAEIRATRALAVQLGEAVRPLAALGTALPKPCRAARIVAAAVARARQRFPALRVEVRPGDAGMRAVPQHVTAALVEIFANAFESAPDGLVTVAISADGQRVRIEVRDEGAGFTAAGATTAADPFTTAKPGHAGMGLYVARRALALSGGTIGAAAGDGGRVWIDLPQA